MMSLWMCAWLTAAQNNALTEAEKKAGWKLLFDGKTTEGWRGYKINKVPDGWKVVDGILVQEGGKRDLITTDQFESFELAVEWKLSKGGNSGIMYRCSEEGSTTWVTGPEYQLLDDDAHKVKWNAMNATGSAYAIYPATQDARNPIGEWNSTRILVSGNHVEHWLNGAKIVEYELGGEDWRKRVEASKFKSHPEYGKVRKGHIALQEHGGRVEFRNIKIRVLGEK